MTLGVSLGAALSYAQMLAPPSRAAVPTGAQDFYYEPGKPPDRPPTNPQDHPPGQPPTVPPKK